MLRGSEQLTGLVGQRLLVGLSYVDPDGTELSAIQFCGRVLEVGEGVVVVANPEGEEPVVLPADAVAYTVAATGRYTLRHSGEMVVDPDYLTAWTIVVGQSGQPEPMTPATPAVPTAPPQGATGLAPPDERRAPGLRPPD